MLSTARIFVIIGVAFIIMGGLFYLFARTGIQIGKLPGNLRIQGENFTCVFALGASLLLSILLTLILNLILRFLNK